MGIIKGSRLVTEDTPGIIKAQPERLRVPSSHVLRGMSEEIVNTIKLEHVQVEEESEATSPIPLISEGEDQSYIQEEELDLGSDDEQLSLSSAMEPEDPLADLDETDTMTPGMAQSPDMSPVDMEDALKKAREEAYKEGLEEGEKEAKVHANSLLDAINELSEKKNDVIEGAEESILELAIDIAKKITQKEIQTDPTILHEIVKDALTRVVSSDKVIIRANKDDIEGLNSQLTAFQSVLNQVGSVTILEDANQQAGGCIIETDFGYIDVSVSTKLHMIRKVLMDVNRQSA